MIFDIYDADMELAQEIAAVGIMPFYERYPIGDDKTVMAGQKFVITGYATEFEFKAAFLEVTGEEPGFLTSDLIFHRVSTD